MLKAVAVGLLYVTLRAVNQTPAHDSLTRQARGQR